MSALAPMVVVSGATGFVGAAVLRQLVSRGAGAVALVRPTEDRQRIASLGGYQTVSFRRLDEPGLAEQLRARQPAVLIHCAWGGLAGAEREAACQITDNVPLTIASVSLAAACGCRQWIGLGSQAEYGNPNRVIAESAPTQPTTIYGKAKLAAGLAALALCEATGLAGVWLRLFQIYGPGDVPQRFIPYVIREFLSGRRPQLTACKQSWDYLYIDDAAAGILSAADGSTTGVFNLGSGQTWPLTQIVGMIKEELGTPIEPAYGAIPYRPDQVMHLQADIGKLRAATGWSPRVGLVEGLRLVIGWERELFAASHKAG